MTWSAQQDAALKAVRAWLGMRTGPQVFRLFGYAGTGKTTLAKEVEAMAGGLTLYATFTGKAALVLRKKGCTDASTIHSAIYKPIEDPITGETTFRLNHDSAVGIAKLVIIDEVSMVGEELARDLLSFGTKLLVLGDPAQLPPVKGEGYFINVPPDFMLTEVHRQAADNPIIRMSMDVREGRPLQVGSYGDSVVVRRKDISKDTLREYVLSADQMLCGLNRTRQTFNARIRELKGIAGKHSQAGQADWVPTIGDRLVCLRNNRLKGLLNGGLWDVDAVQSVGKQIKLRVASIDEPDAPRVDVDVPAPFFTGGDKDLDWRERKKFDEFTYGYALTVHKSQGSQWDNVLLFDESAVFREDAAKHLYTGITRAAERVTVVV